MSVEMRAFLDAVVEIELFGQTWVGEPADRYSSKSIFELPETLTARAVILTACNPLGNDADEAENMRLTKLLSADLEGLDMRFFECIGRDDSSSHAEQSFWIPSTDSASDTPVMNLAAKYEQLAVFIVNGHTRTLQMIGSLEFYEQKIHWEMKFDG